MHNQADSLQITKKQDETERNKQKKKKTAHIWKQSGQPFPHSHSQIGSVGSNFQSCDWHAAATTSISETTRIFSQVN